MPVDVQRPFVAAKMMWPTFAATCLRSQVAGLVSRTG
jgi:hypothetical protein